MLGKSPLLSAECDRKVVPVRKLLKKIPSFQLAAREKFAAVSRLTEISPATTLEHTKEGAWLQVVVEGKR
jgi:hypothetical protein